MSKYVSDFGEEFENYDDALENMYETMELEDYIDGLKDKISLDTLLRYCWSHGNFFDDFIDEIEAVERDFFEENYHEVEDEDC